MKNVKIEWCENFIKSVFKKHVPFENGGIETGCFLEHGRAFRSLGTWNAWHSDVISS